ncbi:SGNH/GDSL hydrolase family protein [Ruminococcus sp. HUN007]|uniref:SGNH/GDSL hydrolase family protein n=1 Tax=Ruminococcus sp. HUN007 TaxID=1514668 RepID=UPI0005D199E2|nr:SGNH/GDSL hydrolase family protein [Ruminococcus sp. HUN007]
MKANLKRILGIVISFSLLASVTISSVSAKCSFTAGDSIASGIGPVAAGESAFESFAECVTYYLIHSGRIDVGVSDARIGATSAQILNYQIIAGSTAADVKYVMISSGGNDYLDLFEEALKPYMDEGDTLATLTPEKRAVITQKISADQTAFTAKLAEVNTVTENAAANAVKIVDETRAKYPDAEIYFLEMYNPFDSYLSSDNDTMRILGTFAQNSISAYNKELAAIDGIKLVPVFENFKGRSDDYIRSGDVHPTEAGHIKIAELIISDITGEDNDTILSNIIKYEMIDTATFNALPEDMRSDIDPDKIIGENAVTTAAVTDAPPVISSVDWTTAAVTTTAVSKIPNIPANGGGYIPPEETTTAVTTEAPASSTTTVSVKSVSSSPATSDRGISPVVLTGFFTAAAACVMLRKKK